MKTARFVTRGLATLVVCWAVEVSSAPVEVKIPAQPVGQALKALAQQTGIQLLVDAEVLPQGALAPAVTGEMSVEEALQRLLEGTGLGFEFVSERTVAIREKGARQAAQELPGAQGIRLAQTDGDASPGMGEAERAAHSENNAAAATGMKDEEEDAERAGIPEILVTGSKMRSLNTDIRRTQDDTQPYAIFDREDLENSGAINLEEFFKNKLTMAVNPPQSPDTNTSTINLRGLGADETLILVDGRRVAARSSSFGSAGVSQPDLNGIPLQAIERIEVLPATASGIYGGSATGGVINIVLRRDYSGVDAQLTYGNSFESDVAHRRVDFSGGFNLGSGKTNVLISGSYSEANPLLTGERDFVNRGRQHILQNSPSFFYSSVVPPLGSTPNVRSATGVNLTLKDGTPLGSPITFVPVGYLGTSSDGGRAFVENAGNYNLSLADTAQSGGRRRALLNNPTVKSAMLTLRHDFEQGAQVFLALDASRNEGNYITNVVDINPATISANAPNNPFAQNVIVRIPAVGADSDISSRSENVAISSGVIVRLPREWRAQLEWGWNRSRFSLEVPPRPLPAIRSSINNGAIDVLRDISLAPLEFTSFLTSSESSPGDVTLKNGAIRLAGPLPWSLPAGNVILTTLLERREEFFGEVITNALGSQILIPDRSQAVNSAYVEARFPLVSERNRVGGIHLLDLQMAVRRDDYKVNGSDNDVALVESEPVVITRVTNKHNSTDPTVGLRYQPMADVTLRTSYGTGYLPPSVTQLVPAAPNLMDFGGSIVDPLRGNEPIGVVTLTNDGNRDLKPEQSTSWSAGIVFTPRQMQGLRLSADWTVIKKTDNISSITFGDQFALDNEAFVPGLVTRSPPSSDNQFSVGSVTEIDTGLFNIAKLKVEALDLAMSYTLSTPSFGSFDLIIAGTRLASLETQLAPTAPVIENAGASTAFSRAGGGLKWKANASVEWNYKNWMLGWATRFFDSYYLNTDRSVVAIQGSASVPSQIYHDFFSGYQIPSSNNSFFDILSDAEIRFGVNNVFNKEPPIDVFSNTVTSYSFWSDPRLANYYLSIRKSLGQ